MQYRALGRTGLQVSAFSLGSMVFGWKVPREEAFAIIDAALEAGINLIDTSNSYGRGASEEIIGAALKHNGRRQRTLLATKVHNRMDDSDPNAFGNSRKHIIQQCDASLKRLQTDYIDLYQVHRPQSSIPIDETLRALDDLIRAGKVLYVGTSTFAAWQIMESLWVSHELGLNRFICDQSPYNLLDRTIEMELIPLLQTYGMGLIGWSPLAEGILTGKYAAGTQPAPESRLARLTDPKPFQERLTNPVLNYVEKLRSHCVATGRELSQFSLAWCLSRPGLSSTLLGPSSLGQLQSNLKALEIPVTPQDEALVNSLIPSGSAISRYYTADFGPHLHRW